MQPEEILVEIERLRVEKNAVILAHYYQEGNIQDVADFVGDSLGLAQQASGTDAQIIVFAGVHFMAETAKILNPSKKVLLPDMEASCSLAESCPPEEFRAFVKEHPKHKVVSYINCSADIKAMSDIICTSSNAEKIISAIPKDQPIIFSPDKNLGRYLEKKLGREMVIWDGACIVHEAFSLDKIKSIQQAYPTSVLIAHPESEDHILKEADFIGSTSAMINYVLHSEKDTFIVATEAGILHKLSQAVPSKKLIPAPVEQETSCACSECVYMKKNTLEKLYMCLRDESPEILLDEAIRIKALTPIEKMLAF
jgi:quinolinate synthase